MKKDVGPDDVLNGVQHARVQSKVLSPAMEKVKVPE
jgi:hypothetical protein